MGPRNYTAMQSLYCRPYRSEEAAGVGGGNGLHCQQVRSRVHDAAQGSVAGISRTGLTRRGRDERRPLEELGKHLVVKTKGTERFTVRVSTPP